MNLEYCANRPELARFMLHEGVVQTPRLTWLFENHSGELIHIIRERIASARALTGKSQSNVLQLTYLLMGASVMFSQGAEYQLVTGERVNSKETIDSYSELVASLILS